MAAMPPLPTPLILPAAPQVRIVHAQALLAAGIQATLERHAPGGGRHPVLVTDLAQALRAPHAAAVLVVEGGLTPQKVKALLDAGVQGCVSADSAAADLLTAVDALGAGRTYFCPHTSRLLVDALMPADLTEREQRVLELLCEGLGNKSIAEALDIAVGTVKTHVKAILTKTGLRTRTAVAAQAIRQGWVPASA